MHINRAVTAAVPAALALSLAPIVAATATAAPAHAAGHTKVSANCVKDRYEPKTIILACADANSILTHIKYASWTNQKATGSAMLKENECVPDCAAGNFSKQAAEFVLKQPKVVSGVRVFTRVVVIQRSTWSPGT